MLFYWYILKENNIYSLGLYFSPSLSVSVPHSFLSLYRFLSQLFIPHNQFFSYISSLLASALLLHPFLLIPGHHFNGKGTPLVPL